MHRIGSNRRRVLILGLCAVLVGAVAAVVSIAIATEEPRMDRLDAGEALLGQASAAQTASVQEVEIREYQGERLGSADDFRENSIAGVQTVDAATYRLVLDGLVGRTQSWSYADLGEMEHLAKLVTIHCVEGWSVKALWEGVPLAVLFERALPLDEANTVIFHAADGYTTSLPLEFVLERNLILADTLNGVVLPAKNGFPFQLVAEDKWGYKWIRWIVRIELSDDPTYRGFWESRGYSNQGDADGPKFGD